MSRRTFLKSVGLLGGAGFASGQESPQSAGLELGEIDVIDVHVHPPQPMTLRQSYDGWNSSFVDALLPAYDYPQKEELREKLGGVFKGHLYRMPRQIGYYNYMARVYGVEPTLEGFDSVLETKLQGDFTEYISSILDRERIPAVVLQSRSSEPVRPESAIPRDRFVWTYAVGDLIQPTWPRAHEAKELGEVLELIDTILKRAAENDCRGIKIPIAYYRPIVIEAVEREEAASALKSFRDVPPSGQRAFPGPIPLYDDPAISRAVHRYQDFLLKHMYVRAGEMGLKVIIHTAVGLHPGLRFDYNSPVDMYHTFQNDDVKRAYTEFVLIHTGYPYHHHVAALLSQFPNVYTDVSFYAKFPGTLEETLRAFLSLAPSEKVMHGSDSNNVPEEIGYCADNGRRVLGKLLGEFQSYYGWTRKDCLVAAENVLSENARRIYRIS
ncbi:MAG TPA: amidohydrolase family protein, partial [Vicinamibacteria bacterium]